MKTILTVMILLSSVNAGFFNKDQIENTKVEKQENSRLCKIFTTKANEYKSTMREDELAKKTLESYQKRANAYCTKS